MTASRPTIVYMVMLACSAVGLWVILALGQRLKPPPNIAGEWLLTPATADATTLGSTMHIEQSGRFLQVSFENTPTMGFHMAEPRTPSHVQMSRIGWTLEFDGLTTPDSARLTINASDEGHTGAWMIHRVVPAKSLKEASSRGGH